jgi:hypothetical protein
MLGLKCANLDGPTVLFVTTLFWYVWHVKRCWSIFLFVMHIKCSSSAGVIWNIRCFRTEVFATQYSGIFGMCKGAKDTIDHSNLLDPDHHHRFLYLTNNEKFVLSILFSNKITLCALRPVIFSHFLTCFKTFCRGQYGESHYNWQYRVQ